MMIDDQLIYTATYILSTGRSGTTVLARALGGHPEVVVRDVFPFENRTSQHLYLWAENHKSCDFRVASEDRDSGVKFQLHQRDDSLSREWFEERSSQMRSKRVVNITDDYYAHIANIQGKSNARFYLEKSIGFSTIGRMHKWGWPLRVVLLVRDPRDILLSVKSFNKKRNVLGFGADKHSETELVQGYLKFFLSVRRMLQKQGIHYVEVQYEDLLLDPEAELSRLADRLGINAHNVDDMLASYGAKDENVKNHRTKTSTSGALRWKSEMASEQLVNLRTFNDGFENLGYEAC